MRGERLHFDVESTRDLKGIDRQSVNLEFTEELLRLAVDSEELISESAHLLALPRLLPGFLGQHLNEIVGHLLILSRETGIVPVELVDGGGRGIH